MATLAEIREQYPAYSDRSDEELAGALYQKFYTNRDDGLTISREDFNAKLGLTPAPANEPTQPPPPDASLDETFVENVQEEQRPPEPPQTGMGVVEATGARLQNVPETYQVAMGGLRQGAAEFDAAEWERIGSLNPQEFVMSMENIDPVPQLLEWARGEGLDVPEGRMAGAAFARALPGKMTAEQRQAFTAVMGGVAGESAAAAQGDIKAAREGMVPVDVEQGSAAYYISGIVGSVAEMGPGFAASIATGNPAPALAFIGALVGGQSYAEGREKGLPPDLARSRAGLMAMAEAIPEALPLHIILKPGGALLKRMVQAGVAEGAQEAFTESLQILVDQDYLNEDMTWAEARQRIGDAAIMGAGAGPVFAGAAHGAEAIKNALPSEDPGKTIGREMNRQIAEPSMAARVDAHLWEQGVDPAPITSSPPQPEAPFDPQAYVDKMVGVESGGRADARNPNSSAGGLGQFIDATWVQTVKEHAPEIAQQYSRAQIIDMKIDTSPEGVAFHRKMIEAFSDDNRKGLEAAGIEVNDGNLYLAHFAGLGGAKKVLKADPSTPVADVLGDAAVKANPFLKSMTAGDLIAWAGRKMSGEGTPMVAPGERVQPDMLGGPEVTETEMAARETFEQRVAEVEAGEGDLFSLYMDYVADPENAEAKHGIERLEAQGVLGKGFVEAPDFKTTFPLPVEGERADAFDGAETPQDAFENVRARFRDDTEVIENAKTEFENARKAGNIPVMKGMRGEIGNTLAGIDQIYGPDARDAFGDSIDANMARFAAEIRRAEKGEGGRKEIGTNSEGQPVFEDERGVRSVSTGEGVRATETVGVKPGGGVSINTDRRKGSQFETTEEAGPTEPGLDKAGELARQAAQIVKKAQAEPPSETVRASGTDTNEIGETADVVANSDPLSGALLGDGFKSITDARKVLGEMLGEDIEAGTEGAKKADEIIEARVVELAREIVAKTEPGVPTFRALVSLYNNQPRLGVRTSTSITQQAYSTPVPLAYLAAWRAGIGVDTVTYEPTAGNGALLITVDPANAIVNELSAERVKALQDQGFRVTAKDATTFMPKRVPDAVIANPPFGAVRVDGKRVRWEIGDGYSTAEIDHAISLRALQSMHNDGTAALIIAGPDKQMNDDEARADKYAQKSKAEFFLWLKSNYNVADHFTVSGDLYARQGAAWAVDVILINGKGKSDRPLPAVQLPIIYRSWDALEDQFDGGQLERHNRPADDDGTNPRKRGTQPVRGGAGVERGGDERRDRGRDVAGEPKPDRARRDEPSDDGGTPSRPAPERPTPAEPREDAGTRKPSGVSRPSVDLNENGQAPYKPASGKASLDTLNPVNMASDIAAALARVAERAGSVDAFVSEALGIGDNALGHHFSAEQIDALALAIDNTNKGRAFIIGDQTGIGKGRVVAGMVRYAIRQGHTPVFVTEKPDLYIDMIRDLVDVGIEDMLGRQIKPLVTNSGLAGKDVLKSEDGRYEIKTKAGKAHDARLHQGVGDADVVFTTYSQMQTVKGGETPRRQFLSDIAADSFIIFDESHNAGGTKSDFEEKDKAPGRADFARSIAGAARSVMFSSATYAKRPEVMDLYARTDMSLAVSDMDTLARAMDAGGIPMQQAVASMLARAGQYIRRERSFKGIEYRTTETQVDRDVYAKSSEIMGAVQRFSESTKKTTKVLNKTARAEAKKITGDNSTGGAGVESSNFTSVMHNVIEQVLLAIKAQPAADMAIAALKRGEKPVLTVSFTLESSLKEYIEDNGLNTGDVVSLDFRTLFRRYLEKSRIVTEKRPFMKKGEKGEKIYLTDEMLGPDGVAAFEAAADLIAEADFGSLPASPIDHMRAKIIEAGYTVSEITGRQNILRYDGDVAILEKRLTEEQGSAGKQRTKDGFNSGKIDALILNQSGSTGISLHAGEKFKDQKPRRMILVQPERNIDTHMQMLGRINRTGQTVLPGYDQLIADIPAEIRPAAVLAKKMASLNANTTASRRSAVSSDEALDILNPVGDEVIAELLDDMPGLNERLGDPLKKNEDGNFDVARKVTGRIPLLPLEEQESLYEEIFARYGSKLEQYEEQGLSPLEAKMLDLQARVIASEPRVAATGPSPFQEGVDVETLDVVATNKPATALEAARRVAEAADTTMLGEPIDIIQAALDGYDKTPLEDAWAAAKKYRDEATDRAKTPETAEKIRDQVNDALRRFGDVTRQIKPGSAIEATFEDGSIKRGIVVKVDSTGNPRNPVAGSAWRVQMAMAGGGTVTLPFTKIALYGQIPAKGALISGTDTTSVLAHFDRMATVGARENRTMLTGNLLAAYELSNGEGQIVNFTMEDGETRQGIIMNRGQALADQAAMLRTADEVLNHITDHGEITTDDGGLKVIYQDGGGIRFEAAGSKRRGARYFLNEQALAVAGRDFISVGGVMRADFTSALIPRDLLQIYLDNGARFTLKGEELAGPPGPGVLAAIADNYLKAGDVPMPNHQPLYRSMPSVPRPADDLLQIGNRSVKLRPLDRPTRREGIRIMLQDIIGARVYAGKVKGKAEKLGFYRARPGEVRTRQFDDVETLAHEMAHWMDHHTSHDGRWTDFKDGKTTKTRGHGFQVRAEVENFSYTSGPAKRVEGWAEFIRLWLTRREALETFAPIALAEFERVLARRGKFNRKMLNLQEEMHRWFMQGDMARFRAKSGKELTAAQTMMEFLQRRPAERVRQAFIDRIHAAKVVERRTTGGISDATTSAYKQMQLINGAEGIHEAVMRYGTPQVSEDGSMEYRGKGLNNIFWPVAKHGYKRFDLLMDYFKARRGQELTRQGRENLFTPAEINAGLALGREHPEFRAVFDEFQTFNGEMLDFYVEMGLITEDQRTAFQAANANYVPFHRVIERLEDPEGVGQGIGARLTGGDRNTKDIAENIVEGLFANIRAAMLARAKQTLYNDILQSDDGAIFAARIAPDSKKVKAHLDEMARKIDDVLVDFGMVAERSDIEQHLDANPAILEFWLHGQPPKTAETYVDSAVIDGKRTWFEVRDPLLVDMLTGMRGMNNGVLLRALFSAKNVMTRTVTNMMQFLGPNAVRDTLSSAVLSRNNFVPVVDTLIGMGHHMVRSKLHQEFMLNGGGYGTRIEAITSDRRARRKLDLPSRNLWDVSAKALAGWDRFTSAFEYGSRIGDFRRGKRRGITAAEAAWEAREIATDFSKVGRNDLWAKYIRTVPFMNAATQGLDKVVREIAEIDGKMTPKNLARLNALKAKFLLKGAVLTSMTAILWLINRDDERYQGLTADQKARYWWIFTPKETGGEIFKIPRPYDIGHIFGTIPEIAMEYQHNKNGKAAADMLAFTAMQTFAVGDYPGIFQPWLEVGFNERFTGAPIVPTHMLNLPPEMQYKDRTPIMYRRLGEAMGVSPLVAEHYTRGYLRYVEAYIADASEATLWDQEKWGARPFARNVGDYIMHQFQGQKVPYRTRWTEGYYELKTRAAGMAGAIRMLEREAIRDVAPLDKALRSDVNQTLVLLNKNFSEIDKQFKDMPNKVAAIKYDRALTAAEKETRIEKLYGAKNTLLGDFYKEAEAAINDAEQRMAK